MMVEQRTSGLSRKGNDGQIMDVVLLSPYHGGSHLAWAYGLRDNSRNNIQLLTMPDRFWKWRMHGGAITLAREFLEAEYDVNCLVATDMLDLSTFLAIARRRLVNVPAVLYMHENQLTYPLPDDPAEGAMRRQLGERDLHYAFVNVSSMHVADVVLFNSEFHRREFFSALPNFLKHFPDFNELQLLESLEAKSQVLSPGVDLKRLDAGRHEPRAGQIPLILWNHRWEYDKDPGRFFDALFHIQEIGLPFRLALCGRNYRRMPEKFIEGQQLLAPNIIHSGYADDDTYIRLLWEASIVVSTARHEFFGISTVEAIYCHSLPILPGSLSYPEIIPGKFHDWCLYSSQDELVEMLKTALLRPNEAYSRASLLSAHVAKYEWMRMAADYDSLFHDIRPK